jgi:hypothetical protein
MCVFLVPEGKSGSAHLSRHQTPEPESFLQTQLAGMTPEEFCAKEAGSCGQIPTWAKFCPKNPCSQPPPGQAAPAPGAGQATATAFVQAAAQMLEDGKYDGSFVCLGY